VALAKAPALAPAFTSTYPGANNNRLQKFGPVTWRCCTWFPRASALVEVREATASFRTDAVLSTEPP